MFEKLMAKLQKDIALLNFELTRTYDVYRLAYLLSAHALDISNLYREVNQMVKELEEE